MVRTEIDKKKRGVKKTALPKKKLVIMTNYMEPLFTIIRPMNE